MDCGKNVTVETNSRMLGFLHQDGVAMVSKTLKSENSTIIAPCFIDDDGINQCNSGSKCIFRKGCHVVNATIKNSLIQTHSHINASLDNAMIGNHASFDGNFTSVNIGDYSVLE
jgi:glucose-1-phosphate thymidylyltransferase